MICMYCHVIATDDIGCRDCIDLVNTARQAISVARQVGVPKYGPSSWRDDNTHLLRAYEHLRMLLLEKGIDPNWPIRYAYEPNEDHLSHAICRLAMAKALLNDNI